MYQGKTTVHNLRCLHIYQQKLSSVINIYLKHGMIFTGVLLYFHVNLLLKGQVTYEGKHHISKYDLGQVENIKQSFTYRWANISSWNQR
ncbi:hypothetical protein QE152_g30769 [Popillia japonica]|uniref:Uncharacterized protein n=1 Tax=Popillia japonica TaxID=7064 RepID=A0AAW1JDT4_POPJA